MESNSEDCGESPLRVGPNVMKRINALRQLQVETVKIQTAMYEEVFKLERKCARELSAIQAKRLEIVNGTHEPGDVESACPVPMDSEATVVEDPAIKDESKGIPDFWLRVLKSAPALAEMIHPHDEAVLTHLSNITCEYDEIKEVTVENPDGTSKTEKLSGFTLKFHFNPNDFFTNTVLTKSYSIRLNPDDLSPFQYAGPEITGCGGCEIEWKPGKNVTVRSVRRKLKRSANKGAGAAQYVVREIAQDSFFLLFKNPTAGENQPEEELLNELLEDHFDLGHFICEKLIPDAILFYTGESQDLDYDTDDECEDDDDDELSAQGSGPDSDSFDEDEYPHRGKPTAYRNGSGRH